MLNVVVALMQMTLAPEAVRAVGMAAAPEEVAPSGDTAVDDASPHAHETAFAVNVLEPLFGIYVFELEHYIGHHIAPVFEFGVFRGKPLIDDTVAERIGWALHGGAHFYWRDEPTGPFAGVAVGAMSASFEDGVRGTSLSGHAVVGWSWHFAGRVAVSLGAGPHIFKGKVHALGAISGFDVGLYPRVNIGVAF